jgi:hypothetical protein
MAAVKRHAHDMADRFRRLIAYDPLAGLRASHKKPKRKDGGRIHKAGGGAMSDEDMGIAPAAPKAMSDADMGIGATPTAPTEPDMGKLAATWQGAKSGATFNFNDELAGISAAKPEGMPEFVNGIPTGMITGAGRLAYEHLFPPQAGIGDTIKGEQPKGPGTIAYEKARDEERKTNDLAKAQHPYLHMAGEIAGSLPAMAVLPEAGFASRAAPLASKAAKFGRTVADAAVTGGEYGGISGFGEGKGTADSAVNAAEGIVGGVIGGAAAPVVGGAVGAAYNKFGKPLVSTVRGLMDPESEAARRLATALRADQEMIQAGKAQGMSPTEWVQARAAGEPVTLADLGSTNTQALLRSAANTSPEGRAILEKQIYDRFAGQSERVASDVRGLVAGGANAGKTGDQLVAEYDQARVPAYRQAYREGDKPIMSPAIERLMGSDTFVNAMKKAISTGKDRDIEMGLGGFNPMVNVTPDGRIVFNKGAKGVPTYPNLQYWDQVKRELDSVASQAKRSGDTSSSAGSLAKILRGELDQQVPSYANARGIAAQYFGEDNALEAGQKLAGKKVDPQQISDVMRKMKPDERDLFREGYASDWAGRVIGNMGDSRDITKAMFNSPNERARALAVFGPQGVQKMQTRMTLETIMDGARKAMGNSTTARQLIEAGLAGGALGGYEGYEHGGIFGGLAGASAGAGQAAFVRKQFAQQIAAGAGKLIGKVDARTAKLVAELLTSNDPNKLQKGLMMAQKNQNIADGLRGIANRVALAGQNNVPRPQLGSFQGPVPVSADDKQQKPVGP